MGLFAATIDTHLRRAIPNPVRRRLGRFVPDNIRYNWAWDMVAGVCAGIYQGCVWTFALQLARGSLHATPFQMGLAVAAPAAGYLFAMLAARQMEGRPKLPFISVTWTISRGLFLLTPLLVRGPSSRAVYVSLICVTPILFSISTPAYTAIMKEIYPDSQRGRLMSYVRIGMSASMLISARVMGMWQEHGGLDFRWMFAIGGVFGVGTAFAFSRLRLPPMLHSGSTPPIRTFVRETLGILIHNRGFLWFTTSVSVAGFGNLMAGTFYPMYQVDRFHITPTQIATMQILTGLVALFSLFIWGTFMDRHGPLAAVLSACVIILIQPLCYAFGPSLPWLYLGSVAGGVAGFGIDLGYLNTTLMFAEPGRAAQYQALHSSFFGLRGTIAPLLAAPLLASLGYNFRTAFCLRFGIMATGVMFHTMSLVTFRRRQLARYGAEAEA